MNEITERLIQDYILWKYHTEAEPSRHRTEGEWDEYYKQFSLDVAILETMREEND